MQRPELYYNNLFSLYNVLNHIYARTRILFGSYYQKFRSALNAVYRRTQRCMFKYYDAEKTHFFLVYFGNEKKKYINKAKRKKWTKENKKKKCLLDLMEIFTNVHCSPMYRLFGYLSGEKYIYIYIHIVREREWGREREREEPYFRTFFSPKLVSVQNVYTLKVFTSKLVPRQHNADLVFIFFTRTRQQINFVLSGCLFVYYRSSSLLDSSLIKHKSITTFS